MRAAGVQLIGEQPGSGYRRAPALVRRADGQMISLTELLYRVLQAVDGTRGYAQIADEVSAAYGRRLTRADPHSLVDGKLRPLGLVRLADGGEPELRRSNPLLGLRGRVAVTDPETTRRITAPFAMLFSPVLVVVVVAAFLAVCWWVLFAEGLAAATHEALHRPGLLLLIFAVTVLSAGFHEFGHAAAARYGGATPGTMGMGFYLFWPAFYTDVTDSYRLGRGGRVRTDLGGLYFNAIVAVAIVAAWKLTGYDALLLVVATQILQMIRQLTPLVRFDGYHVLADLTGVPDLYGRIGPTVLSILPWRWRDPEATALKLWARVVVTVWVLVVVPLLALSLFLMVVALPRVLATAWESLQARAGMLRADWGDGDLLGASAQVLSVVALAFPVLGMVYLLTRLVRQVSGAVLRRTRGKPGQRATAVLAAGALLAGLAWAWWPDGDTYRPISPNERGTVTQALALAPPAPQVEEPAPSAAARLESGARGRFAGVWPGGGVTPTADTPELAMVLIPRGGWAPAAGGDASGGSATDVGGLPDPNAAPAWVFPFDRPLPPGAGNNQSLAVNTTDGTVVYDVAFAWVWVEDDTVLNRNEAYALASCTDCAAVAISFQVVLVVGDADIVVPQNVSVAVNYNCVRCLTYALATQLVVTLDGPLDDATVQQLAAVWQEIGAFASSIATLPLSELRARLSAYEDQILSVLSTDPAVVAATAPADGTPTSSGGATATDSTAPADTSGSEAPPATASSGAVPESTGASTTAGETTPAATTAPATTSSPEPIVAEPTGTG